VGVDLTGSWIGEGYTAPVSSLIFTVDLPKAAAKKTPRAAVHITCSSDSEANDGGGGGAFAAGGGEWNNDYDGTLFTDSFREAAEDLEE
jgi:hypothetical protein